MNHYCLVAVAITIVALSAVERCTAQQNLFNVPSGDLTRPGGFFYQQQLNAYSLQSYESKWHLVYGITSWLDGGINVVDLPITARAGSLHVGVNGDASLPPVYPVVMATLQSQVKFSDDVAMNVGTQVGSNFLSGSALHPVYMNYALLRVELPEHAGFVLGGPFQANDAYFGAISDRIHYGVQAGFELRLHRNWYLMGDIISGGSKKSSSTLGAVYNVSSQLQICVAALLAVPNRTLNPGVVVEVNWYSYDFMTH